jgi:DHA1 family multidrug resistance protein-like MFS transporter
VKEEQQQIQKEKSPGALANLHFAMQNKDLVSILTTIFIAQMAIVFVSPIFPYYLEELFTPSAYLSTITGIMVGIVGVFSVIFAPYWGRRNDKKGYAKTLIIASVLVGLSLLLQSIVPDYRYLFPLRAVMGIFTAAIIPTLYAAFSKRTPQENRSGLMALASSATLLGNLISPALCGMLAPLTGMRICVALSGVMMLLVALYAWNEYLKTKRLAINQLS